MAAGVTTYWRLYDPFAGNEFALRELTPAGIADVVNVPDGWRHSRGNHLNDWSLLDLLHYHASFSVAGLFGPSGSDIFDAMPLRAASPC